MRLKLKQLQGMRLVHYHSTIEEEVIRNHALWTNSFFNSPKGPIKLAKEGCHAQLLAIAQDQLAIAQDQYSLTVTTTRNENRSVCRP